MQCTKKITVVQKNIFILSSSQWISDIGTASYISFVNLWLIQVFKDSAVVGTILSITEIAMFFLSPLISTFIKGKNIKSMLIISDYVRAAVMIVLVLVMNQINEITIIALFIALSTLNCVFDGAVMVVIKRIGEKSNLVKLNTFLILLANVSLFIGQYAGGRLFTADGIQYVFIINAVSFFISGLINHFLHNEYCLPTKKNEKNIIKDIFTAIKAVTKNKTSLALIIAILLINIHASIASFSAYFLFSGADQALFQTSVYTYFIMAGTAGTIIGLLIISYSGDKLFGLKSLVPLLCVIAICRIGHFAVVNIVAACLINGVICVIIGILNSLLEAYILHSIDEHYIGQYYTVFGNISQLLSPLITYGLGYVLRFVFPVYVYASSGIALFIPILYIHIQMKKIHLGTSKN